jgi:hypothetical protein
MANSYSRAARPLCWSGAPGPRGGVQVFGSPGGVDVPLPPLPFGRLRCSLESERAGGHASPGASMSRTPSWCRAGVGLLRLPPDQRTGSVWARTMCCGCCCGVKPGALAGRGLVLGQGQPARSRSGAILGCRRALGSHRVAAWATPDAPGMRHRLLTSRVTWSYQPEPRNAEFMHDVNQLDIAALIDNSLLAPDERPPSGELAFQAVDSRLQGVCVNPASAKGLAVLDGRGRCPHRAGFPWGPADRTKGAEPGCGGAARSSGNGADIGALKGGAQ